MSVALTDQQAKNIAEAKKKREEEALRALAAGMLANEAKKHQAFPAVTPSKVVRNDVQTPLKSGKPTVTKTTTRRTSSLLDDMGSTGSTFRRMTDDAGRLYSPLDIIRARHSIGDSAGVMANRARTYDNDDWRENLRKAAEERVARREKLDSYALSDADKHLPSDRRQMVQEAKDAWQKAKDSGDFEGMHRAHEKAENVRGWAGYSGGGDGSEYITADLTWDEKRTLNQAGQNKLKKAKLDRQRAIESGDVQAQMKASQRILDIKNDAGYQNDPGAGMETWDAHGRPLLSDQEREADEARAIAAAKAVGYGVPASLLRLSELGGDFVREQAQERWGTRDPGPARTDGTSKALIDAGTKGEQMLRKSWEYQEEALDGLEGVDRLLMETALSMGQNLPGIGLSLIPGVGPAAGAALMGAQAAGARAGELTERGFDTEEAFTRGLLSGGVEMATEALPLSRLVKILKGEGGQNVIKSILAQMAIEGTEEGVAYATNYVLDKYAQDPEAVWSTEDLFKNVAIGAISGGAMATGGSVIGSRSNTTASSSAATQDEETDRILRQTAEAMLSETAQETAGEPVAASVPQAATVAEEQGEVQQKRTREAPAAVAESATTEQVKSSEKKVKLRRIESIPVPVETIQTKRIAEPVVSPAFLSEVGKTLGQSGQKSMKAAWDGRGNQAQYAADFIRVYNQALTGSARDSLQASASMTEAQIFAAYNAGITDRQTNLTEAKRAAEFAVLAGEDSGLVYDDYVKAEMDTTVAKEINTVAKQLGLRVQMVDSVAGGSANAEIQGSMVSIEKGNPNPVRTLFGHEMTHRVQELAPESYREFRDYVMSSQKAQEKVQERIQAYAARNVNLSQEAAMDEVVADYAGELIESKDLMKRFIDQNRKNQPLLGRMLTALKDMAAKLTGKYKTQVDDAVALLEKAVNEAAVQAKKLGKNKNTAQTDGVRYSLKSYSQHQLDNWAASKKIVVYQNEDQLRQFIQDALAGKNLGQKMYFGSVPADLAARIERDTGLNVEGYNCSIAAQEIRKIFKDHGDPAKEALRGQRAIVEDDIVSIPEVIQAPDTIDLSPKQYNGRPVINFVKDLNGRTTVTAYVSGKHLDLTVQTMFAGAKKGNLATPTGVQAPINTPKANSGTVSTANVAQSDSDVKGLVESAEKVGVSYDEKTESASPTRYSLKTWNASSYVRDKDNAAKAMADQLGISQKKAKQYIDDVNSIVRLIADDRVRLDYEPSPGRSAFVSNAEYGGSIDFSTICKKRRLFTGTFEAIQEALPNTALTAEEFLEIRSMMAKKDYEVSCGLCYVEGSRANMGQYTKQFIERYAATNPGYVPNMAEMNTASGQEKIRREHPEVYEAYEFFMNHYGRLKPSDKALFASQQKPKMYQMATEYRGEILTKFGKKNAPVAEKNANGGLRLQSFSDFEIIHLIDSMQVIMDMSRVGLAGQAYTKVPDFAWALGDTGLKINLSLIAKGVKNGKLVLDEVEGMAEADAMALRDRYPDNVGTVLVAFTDVQLQAAMADERIDFIIPFHRSQWKTEQYEAMGLPKNAKDFTPWQNEAYIEPVYNKNGKKKRPDNYMPNNYWNFRKSGKKNAEAYLKMCAENNRRPKFHYLLDKKADGSYALKKDGSTDGYWKLLIDFKMYNNEGKGVPQKPVKPNFNMEQAERMLTEYTGGHSKFPAAQDVVDEFVAKYKERNPDILYSLKGVDGNQNLVEEFDDIPKWRTKASRPKTVEEQALVDDMYYGRKAEEQRVRSKEAVAEAKQEGRDAVREARVEGREAVKAVRAEVREVKRIAVQKAKLDQKARDEERIRKLRERKDSQIADIKAEHRERIKLVKAQGRAERDVAVGKVKEHYKDKEEKAREYRQARELRSKIVRHVNDLRKKLIQPSDNQHIPEKLRSSVAAVLNAINLESSYSYDPSTMRQVIRKDGKSGGMVGKHVPKGQGTPTARTKAFQELRLAYEKILSEADQQMVIDPDLMTNIQEMEDLKDTPIGDLSVSQLTTMWNIIKAVEASITSYNKVFGKQKFETIREVAEGLKADNAGKRDRGDYRGPIGAMDKLINAGMLTPESFFHRLGKTGESLFRMLRNAQDKHIGIMQEAQKYTEMVVKDVDVRKLEKETHTFDVEGQQVTMTTAQIMSLYELMKRQQAVDHVVEGGIRVEAVSKGLKKKGMSEAIRVSPEKVGEILGVLTPKQIEIADGLQKFMGDRLSQLGNEASMEVYGYEKFKEQNYFPIKVDANQTITDQAKDAVSATIAGRGFTKGTKPHANNALMVRNIFDVYADHVTDMATYSAWLAPMENLQRVFNFKFRDENGNLTGTVKGLIHRIYGQNGEAYWKKLTEDLNNGVKGVNDNPFQALIGNYKASAIGANLRVFVQQPTSILRALDSISPADFMAGLTKANPNTWKKVKEYAPIAVWKDWGYFDADTGRQMKSILFGDDSRTAKVNNTLMAPAGAMDSLAWSHIWNALEVETARKHKNLQKGSDDFYKKVAERFNEVVDHTQVVDGILQRSQVMRSPDGVTKMATSFMAEPTKIFNMFTTAAYDLRKSQDKAFRKKASKTMARTSVALFMSFVANAASQSLVDAFRDDDKDEEYWEKFFQAFVGLEGDEETKMDKAKSIASGNMGKALNPFGYLPFVKDIVSLIEGYDVARMDMESISNVVSAVGYCVKSLNGEGKMTPANALLNLAAELSRFLGTPVSNIKRDVMAGINTWLNLTDNYKGQYAVAKTLYDINYTGNKGMFLDIAYLAWRDGDEETFIQISQDLMDAFPDKVNGETIESAMKSRTKKQMEEDVGYQPGQTLEDLIGILPEYAEEEEKEEEFSAKNLNAEEYNRFVEQRADSYRKYEDAVTGSSVWGELDDKAKDKVIGQLWKYAAQTALVDVSGGKFVMDESSMVKAKNLEEDHQVDPGVFFTLYGMTGVLESDKTVDGETISDSLGYKKLMAVRESGLLDGYTDEQQDAVYGALDIGAKIQSMSEDSLNKLAAEIEAEKNAPSFFVDFPEEKKDDVKGLLETLGSFQSDYDGNGKTIKGKGKQDKIKAELYAHYNSGEYTAHQCYLLFHEFYTSDKNNPWAYAKNG